MLWILFSLVFLYLPLTVLTAPTTTTLSCSLSNARLSVPPDQTALTAPTGSPSFIAVAIGVQNYTCNAASRTYTNVGAVAALLDISCYYNTPAFSSIQNDLYTVWSEAPSDFTTGQFISALSKNPLVLGEHYFVPNPEPTASSPAISPKWDFTSGAESGNPMAFVIGAIVGDLPAPESSTDIDWLQIKKVEGLLADSLYRVDTVGGKPPPSCSAGDPLLTVRYTSKYWFFGGNVRC